MLEDKIARILFDDDNVVPKEWDWETIKKQAPRSAIKCENLAHQIQLAILQMGGGELREKIAETLWRLDSNTGDFKSGIKTAWRCVVDNYFEKADQILALCELKHRAEIEEIFAEIDEHWIDVEKYRELKAKHGGK